MSQIFKIKLSIYYFVDNYIPFINYLILNLMIFVKNGINYYKYIYNYLIINLIKIYKKKSYKIL